MKKIINRGFTLIELLVVIAIIGILASIVLVSLNSARAKGKDTRLISDVKEVQTQIETEANAGGSYLDGTGLCITALGSTNAATVASSGSNPCVSLTSDATANGGSITVKTNGASAATSFTAYVVYSNLASNAGQYFCADSTGNVKTETTAYTSGYVCW